MLSKMSAGHWVVLLGVAVLLYAIVAYSSRKSNVKDLMTTGPYPGALEDGMNAPPVDTNEEESNYASAEGIQTSGVDNTKNCMTHQNIDPKDLLPPDPNGEWAHQMSSGNIEDVNMIKAGSLKGAITNCNKNANLQLRPEPTIQRSDVGPWMNSTICAPHQYKHNPLEI